MAVIATPTLPRPSHDASTLTCARCGGSVPLAALASQVACPYCRTPIALAPQQLVELERYRAHVGLQLARADAEYQKAAHWDCWYGGTEARRRNNPWVVTLITIGPVMLLVVGMIAVQASGVSSAAMETLMPFGWGATMFLIFGGYFAWYFVGRNDMRRGPLPLAASVSCPNCGAPHVLDAGAVLDRCRHCGSALMPDAGVMDRGRGQADQAVIKAEIERYRAERRGMLALSNMSAARVVPYYVLGSFLPMTGFGAIFVAFSAISGDRDATPAAVLVMWGLCAANVGALGFVYILRRRKRERWERITQLAIAQFNGRPLANMQEVGVWLDWYWAGPLEQREMFPGPYFRGASLVVHGYNACVMVNPDGASEDYPGYIAIRLGAWLETPDPRHRAVLALSSWLMQFGAELTVERAGIVVRFDEKALKRVGRGSGWELSQSIGAAAGLALELGASRALPTYTFAQPQP